MYADPDRLCLNVHTGEVRRWSDIPPDERPRPGKRGLDLPRPTVDAILANYDATRRMALDEEEAYRRNRANLRRLGLSDPDDDRDSYYDDEDEVLTHNAFVFDHPRYGGNDILPLPRMTF